MTEKIKEEDIFSQLDERAQAFAFLVLDNGYNYPVTARIDCYGDKTRWAIVIECFIYYNKLSGHEAANLCLYAYGNCLKRPPGITDDDFLIITSDGPEGETFDDWKVIPQAKSVTLRDAVIQLDLSKENLERKGITLINEELTAVELFRSLLPEYREQLLATEEELRMRVPADLPMLLRIDEWYHPDIAALEKPSENETFKSIAKVLNSADPSLYKVENAPNSHWSNWPEGGTL